MPIASVSFCSAARSCFESKQPQVFLSAVGKCITTAPSQKLASISSCTFHSLLVQCCWCTYFKLSAARFKYYCSCFVDILVLGTAPYTIYTSKDELYIKKIISLSACLNKTSATFTFNHYFCTFSLKFEK